MRFCTAAGHRRGGLVSADRVKEQKSMHSGLGGWALVITLGLAAATATAQQKWTAEDEQKLVKSWETEVGGIFDKFDRDKDGTWGAREARLGSGAMWDNLARYRAINAQLEQQLAQIPRVAGSGAGPGGVIRGDSSQFTAPFVPPKGPYDKDEPAKTDQFGGNRQAANATPEPGQGASKDQVVKYYVSLIHRLYSYNRFLIAQAEARRNALVPQVTNSRTGNRR